jgi:ankyrin repeat protein
MAFQNNHGRSDDLWGEALGRLSDSDRRAIGQPHPNGTAVLDTLLATTNRAKEICLAKRWKYEGKHGTIIIRDQLEKVTTWIERFMNVGNAVAQYDPAHLSLPWAGLLFLLQLTINDNQTFGAMVEGIELVANVVTRYDLLERIYLDLSRQSPIHKELRENFVKLYVAILRYLSKAKGYFSKPTIKRVIKSTIEPAEAAVQAHLDVIAKKIRSVDSCLDVIKAQRSRAVDEKTSRLLEMLVDIEKPITRTAMQVSALYDHLNINQRANILGWLSRVPNSIHHNNVKKAFLPGSCDWLLRHAVYLKFASSSISSTLWLHGMPGTGKTFLVHNIVEHILQEKNLNKAAAPVAYFYCARNPAEPKRASPDEIMRSLLKQLASTGPDKPLKAPVISFFKHRLAESAVDALDPTPPSAAECVPVILELLEKDPATIVIDAIDECDPSRRHELFSALGQVQRESASLVKILVSSRDETDIAWHYSQGLEIHLRTEHSKEDIERYIDHTLADAIRTRRLLQGHVSESLRSEITTTLKLGAGGMFRWVSLQIDNLCNSQRIKIEQDARQEVGRLPKTLMKSYDVLYERIQELALGSREIASVVLKWLLYAQTLLNTERLIAIVAVASGLPPLSLDSIVDICSSFIDVDDHGIIRLSHLSVREYLERLPEYSPRSCQSLLLRTCLSAYTQESEFVVQSTPRPTEKLKSYAMVYWPVHCLQLQRLDATMTQQIAEPFLFGDKGPEGAFEDWVSDAWNLSQYPGVVGYDHSLHQRLGATTSTLPTPLFLSCCFNLPWVLAKLQASGYSDWTAENRSSEPALTLATQWKSYDSLVWLLENCSLTPENTADALIIALENEDAQSIDLLLQHGVNPYHVTKCQDSALYLAVRCKKSKVVDQLLSTSFDFRPLTFTEALQAAYEDSTEQIFSLMWRRCTELNRSQFLAVLLLLEDLETHSLVAHMVDYARTHSEFTDVYHLVEQGALIWFHVDFSEDESEFKFLVVGGKGVLKDVRFAERSDNEYQWATRITDCHAPLIAAACLKDKAAIRLLIPFCDVNDMENDLTALAVAIALGQTTICSMLLTSGANPNLPAAAAPWSFYLSFSSRTSAEELYSPLTLAVMYNRVDIAALLITYGANVENTSATNSPFGIATYTEQPKMMALLYERGAKVDIRDDQGRPAVHLATKHHKHKALLYLCVQTSADVNVRCPKGKTALMRAVKAGCSYCIDLLLRSGADGNLIDGRGMDAFSYLRYGEEHLWIVKKLLDHGITWRMYTPFIESPLHLAVVASDLQLTRRLLQCGCDLSKEDSGLILSTAIMQRNKDMVLLLIDFGANPAVQSSFHARSPMQLAASMHDVEILQTLLSAKDQMDLRDEKGNPIEVGNLTPADLVPVLLGNPFDDQDTSETSSAITMNEKEDYWDDLGCLDLLVKAPSQTSESSVIENETVYQSPIPECCILIAPLGPQSYLVCQ